MTSEVSGSVLFQPTVRCSMELLAAAAFRLSDPTALPITLCLFARIAGAFEGSIGVAVFVFIGGESSILSFVRVQNRHMPAICGLARE